MAHNTTTTQQQQHNFILPAVLIGICVLILILSIPVIVVVILLFVDILKRLSNTNYELDEPDEPIENYVYKGEKYPGIIIQLESNLVCPKKDNDEIQQSSEENSQLFD